MPFRNNYPTTPVAPSPGPGQFFRKQPADEPTTPGVEGNSDWAIPAGVAAAGAAGLYALTKNPQAIKTGWQGLIDLRRMGMLTGLAPLKSFLGNVGGSAYASIEKGSLAPLRQMLSGQTVKDAVSAFKNGASYSGIPTTKLTKWNIPGRVMGAMDEAAQKALVRSGVMHDSQEVSDLISKGMSHVDAVKESATKAAQREMLQAPIGGQLKDALETPAGQYLVPFQRTPVNQFIEGLKSFTDLNTKGKVAAQATAYGTGALTGSEAEDPRTIAIGAALSGRRGLPFAASAALARYNKTGSKRSGAEALQGTSPVSDYSISEGVYGPITGKIAPLAFPRAYDYLRSMLGMK